MTTRIYRQGVEVAAGASSGHSGDVRLRQVGLEVMARPTPSVDALALPAGVVEAFVHNWGGEVSMETAYQTSVNNSSDNVAEERRALQDRPTRTLEISWNGMDRDSLDRILVVIKKMTENQWVVPLYQDQVYLTQAYTDAPANNNLYCNFQDRRIHIGGRLAIMQFAGNYIPENVAYVTVARKHRDYLILDSNVGFDLTVGNTIVLPCMDVEYVLEPAITYTTDRVGEVKLTLQEVAGPSALVPSWHGLPDGWDVYQDLPIFDPAHDWSTSLQATYRKQGSQRDLGRGIITNLRGDRPRLEVSWVLSLDREEAFKVIRFFDSRMGRALPFFTIDPEDLWDPIASTTSTLDISAQGTFSDLGYFDYVGLRMQDGSKIIRGVDSIDDHSTFWRINLSENFSTAPSVSDIVGVARARKSRFSKDTMEERWVTDDWCRLSLSTIELLEEKEIGE